MIIIPAIDIKDGRCVRLYQGDYDQVTVFSEDPASVARQWAEAGAPLIHVVDLDGAAAGRPVNLAAVQSILVSMSTPIELGGGFRTLESVATALDIGVSRVVLGTIAIERPDLVEQACQRWGEAVVVGIDSRSGKVATRGWREDTAVEAAVLAVEMAALGVRRLICTDILRDGTLTEPNYASLAEIRQAAGLEVIASGGVSRVSHLTRLAALGMEGAIVGRALYTGDLDYAAALAALADSSNAHEQG